AATANIDDPLLTDRSGLARRRPLVRVVLDDRLNVRSDSQLAMSASEAPVLVFTAKDERLVATRLEDLGIEVVNVDPHDPLEVLKTLAAHSLQSVLIEGG